jgi:hypothetical protein
VSDLFPVAVGLVMACRLCAGNLKIPHKKTLFHTIAHFRGCTNTGQAILHVQNKGFANKVKDLAHLSKMHQKAISLEK